MGRLNTLAEQRATLAWAAGYCPGARGVRAATSISVLLSEFGDDLRRYFALAALSRSTTAPAAFVNEALALVFRVRVVLERAIIAAVTHGIGREAIDALSLRRQPLHGYSKKQGISIRMPLSSCVPSKLCGAACYAHDVLDAAPASVVRGAVNGAVAAWYDRGDHRERGVLLAMLQRPVQRMVDAARRDARGTADTFARRPRIRFAHVGEFAPFPEFANALARAVRDVSDGGVDCVVYTRHPDARLLDPELFVVLFSLDESSEDRRQFIPATAHVVRSAFGGRITESVDVNFLEHHRWVHVKPIGAGKVCPATAPETKVRACDACQCDFCFRPRHAPRHGGERGASVEPGEADSRSQH